MRLALASLLAVQASGAIADICKYVDAEGRVVYSNVDVPDARRIDCPIVSAEPPKRPSNGASSTLPAAPLPPAAGTPAPSSRPRAPTPAGFPRVDASTQRSRDDVRRRVLNEELSGEQKSLAEARLRYNNGVPSPLPEEQSDPKRYAERVARLREAVQLHERNVEALRKEIGTIR